VGSAVREATPVTRWWLLIGGLLVAAGLGWWVLQVALLAPAERSTAAGYGQFVLAAIGLLIMIAGPIRKAFTSTSESDLDHVTDLTAEAPPHSAAPVNRLEGDVGGTAIQAGAIYGDVNISPSPPRTDDFRDSPIIVTPTVVARVERTVWGLLGITAIEVLVETRGSQAVVLHGIRPIVLSRQLPPDTWCYAAVQVRGFRVELDADPPKVHPERHGFDPPEVDFPFSVTASDPEMFRLVIESDYQVQFEFELSWTCAGRAGSTLIRELGSTAFTHP
jgi:hypothetical protein